MRNSFTRARWILGVLALWLLLACDGNVTQVTPDLSKSGQVLKVAGEIYSANSRFFSPPNLRTIWQYTISFMAPDGALVQSGDLVLQFDTQELETKMRDKSSELDQKEKELQKQKVLARELLAELLLKVEEARADVAKASLKAEIPESLLAKRDYRENQLLLKQAKLGFALAEKEVEKEKVINTTEANILVEEITVLKTDIAKLKDSIDAMSIYAPSDGVVIHALNQRGNKVAVGDNVWGGRRVIEIPDLSQLELRLEIAERDSARITIGQLVKFTMDAAPDQVFSGKVTKLAAVIHSKSINQPAKIFDATVTLLDPDTGLMRPGMSVNAEILVGLEKVATK